MARPSAGHREDGEVLIIEDDPSAVRLLRAYLETEGYRVRVAGDGQAGLETARGLAPAAIVLDVLLPGIDGWEVLRQLKGDPVLRDVPVVIVTVVDERELGLALGAVDYFVKPVDRTALLARLGRHTFTTKVKERPVRVLVVDDDPGALALVADILTAEGFDVTRAASGREAVARAQEGGIELVICDLLMPDLDGFGVVGELKADGRTRAIPILILTAHELSPTEKSRLNGKIVGVVEKGADARAGLTAWLARVVPGAAEGSSG
jgi:CheY-like chemotaxis protein